VYAGDIARAVEICCRDDEQVIDAVGGRVIEAGGPEGMYIFFQIVSHFSLSQSTIGEGQCHEADDSVHISANHGTRPQVLGYQEVHPQFTLFRGHDPGILFGEIPRESVHSHPGSGTSLNTIFPPISSSSS